jgi:hypothetical protein
VLDRGRVVLHLDEAQLSVAGLGDDHQLNCSSSDGGAGAGMEAQVVVCFATGFALAFYVQQLPLLHLSESDLWGDIATRRCYEQIRDTIAL